MCMALFAGYCAAADETTLKEQGDKVNYSIGYQIGSDFRRQGVDIDPEIVLKGVQDALSGDEPLLKPDEMRATLAELQRRVKAEQQKEQQGMQDTDINAQAMEEQARRRVALGLILSEIVAENDIKVEPAKVREIVESVASGYEKSEEVVKYYYSDKSRLAEVENFALEQQVVDWVLSQANVNEAEVPFDSIMNRG